MNLEKEIELILRKALKQNVVADKLDDFVDFSLQPPKSKKFGDLSTNLALVLAKKIGNVPLDCAQSLRQQICQLIKSARLDTRIEKVEVHEPGFINFFLNKSCLHEILLEINQQGDNFGRSKLGAGKSVHLEFVSANPTGPLNVAHGRQAAFGDTLANLLQFSGYRVTKEYYLNDEGVQIDILGASLIARYLQLFQLPASFPDSGYRGKYIDNLAEELMQKYGRSLVKKRDKDVQFFSRYAYRTILQKIKEDLASFGVKYDSWFSQKRLSTEIKKALGLLKKRGFLYQKDGAWWMASSKFGDDKDRVAIKSDGKLTYITPDIAYHQSKFKRGFSQLINIWGPDHHGYIPRIKAAINALGYDARNVNFLIVQLVSVAKGDQIIPMSTRLGRYISLRDIIQTVGKDVARFFFLMRKRDSHLHFDLELARKQSLENPVYYIQYAHARILNILKFAKIRKTNRKQGKDLKLFLLNKPEELSIIQTLRRFPAVVESCALNLEPHRITTYLQELAKEFHHYYEKHKVVSKELELTKVRLALINAVRIVLNNGLRLLAVSAPEKM